MKHFFLTVTLLLLATVFLSAQQNIYSKEGKPVISRESIIFSCLESLRKPRSDKAAMEICECQAAELDRRFTNQQIRKYTKKNVIDFAALIKEDSLVQEDLQDCYMASGKTALLQAESSADNFRKQCEEAIRESSQKELLKEKIDAFCQCQLEMVKTKQLTDGELQAMRDPNSLLFFELIYRCGSPYDNGTVANRNWSPASGTEVKGPFSDSINVLTINGMTFVKLKVGSLVKVWLFDTGASDMLINADMEADLKKEAILGPTNYLGMGEYEMANGSIDSCRQYRVNGVRLGGFTLDNVIVSVSDKGQRIIVGKTVLNKFRSWALNNQENKLYLYK
ncbi:clan AA aspartic protease [Flavisolibacter sp. BT320]|nr:clan AA aspartic protease [Flavisolibacter longurius]